MLLLAFVMGVLIIIPIGGADMPVVVSMLNSYSGWAAAGIGFSLNNAMLIVAGSLVGSLGCDPELHHVQGDEPLVLQRDPGRLRRRGGHGRGAGRKEQRPVKSGSADDAAYMLSNAETVIIVPGYGLAVARAQHAVNELAEKLTHKGVTVKYAIHPVAGRMPGHMNVLLAEAEVPYDQVFEMEDINGEFAQADVAIILGANDVVNPAALTKGTPIYGMPILEAYKAKTVIVNKRSHGRGLCRAGQRAVLHGQDHDGVRRRQEGGRGHGEGDRVSKAGAAKRPPPGAIEAGRRFREQKLRIRSRRQIHDRPPLAQQLPARRAGRHRRFALPLAGRAHGGELQASTRDRTAYSFMGKDLSYGEVDKLSRAFAGYLQGLGLAKGDRVAVMMPNVPAVPDRGLRHPARRADRGERQSAVHAARAGAPAQGFGLQGHRDHGELRHHAAAVHRGHAGQARGAERAWATGSAC